MDLNKYYYVQQDNGYGLGNFTMCTHTIQALYNHFGTKVNVKFDMPWVAEYFQNAPQINIITETKGLKRLFGSKLINTKIYDGQFIYDTVCTQNKLVLGDKLPTAFAGGFPAAKLDVDVVLFSGNGSNPKIAAQKFVPMSIYNYILTKCKQLGLKIWLVGSSLDWNDRMQYYDIQGCESCIDHPMQIAQIIKAAKLVIANDTGLYHYASAMGKTQFVMWGETNLIKNFNPNSSNYTTISHGSKNWLSDFDKWFEINTKQFTQRN